MVYTILFWRAVDRRAVSALGLARHPGVPGEWLRGIAAAFWLMTLAALPALVFHRDDILVLPGGGGRFLVLLVPYVLAFLLVALNEEIAFRGYLLRNLILRVRPWVAVVILAVLFASMHGLNPHLTPLAVVNLMLAGTFMALAVLRWNSLWYVVAFHFAWNFHQSVILSLPVSGVSLSGLFRVGAGGPEWLTGGDFGPEGSLVTTLLLAVASGRMLAGMPVDMNRSPAPPPCAQGEPCPFIPEEIREAALRGRAGAPG
jgi:membrane protease YdiL (CAAX protease family)